ncbi:MAG: ketoacyl-ACP synthase III [Lachnospiraceae bacterium]|nr:ketoacyl-ACP synthase III [Lachnospiraceae bacterium]
MSAAVPSSYADNDDYAKGDKRLQKLVALTGIHRRHLLDKKQYRLVDIAVRAASDVIKKSNIEKNKIKIIVYVTQNPEFYGPSTAFYVQKELAIGIDCIVFDVNLGCSGFVAGLQIVSSLLDGQQEGDLALLINAECMSWPERENPNDVYLFGDASTAVLVKKTMGRIGKYYTEYYSDGNRYKALFHEKECSPVIMDGPLVFEFSIYEVSKYIKEFLKRYGLIDDDIDHIVFHQAQKFIVDHIAVKANLDRKKLLYSLNEYGNTSSASIPLSICCNKGDLCEHGRFLLSGFGVGLAWGISYIEIDSKVVFGVLFL